MKRLLWAVGGAAVLAALTLGERAGWVRPVALAVLAGALALAYWRRSPARGSADQEGSGQDSERSTSGELSTKDVWDALDRGEDPTSTLDQTPNSMPDSMPGEERPR